MKKRLLSAALALAMALTLLPMSVFAAYQTPGTADPSAVQYNAGTAAAPNMKYFYEVNATTGAITTVQVQRCTTPGDGTGREYGSWYWLDNKNDPQNPKYYKVTTGVIAGNNGSGNWYPDFAAFTKTAADGKKSLISSTFTLLGATDADMSSGVWTSTTLNVDIEGSGTLTLSEYVTNATVTSKFVTGAPTGTVAGLTRDHSGYTAAAPGNAALNLKATNVNVGDINLDGRANQVTLTNCVMTGDVDMNGATDTTNNNQVDKTTFSGQQFSATNCKITGAITITGDGSRVTLTSTTGANASTATGDVTVTGIGNASLTIAGASNVGAVIAKSRAAAATDTAIGAIPTVTVSGGTVTSISTTTDLGPGSASITLNRTTGNTNVGAVTVNKGSVSVAAGVTTDDITVPEGSVTISGSSAATAAIGTGATTATLTLGNTGKTTLSVSGYGSDIEGITVPNGKGANLAINSWPAGRNNDFGAVALDSFSGKKITGGTFDLATGDLPFTTDESYGWINTSNLTYQAKVNGKAVLYSVNDLGQAIDDVNGGPSGTGDLVTDGPAATDGNIVPIGNTATNTLTLKYGTGTLAVIQFSALTPVVLPTRLNSKNISTWMQLDANGKVVKSYDSGKTYTVPAADITLNATDVAADVTKITGIKNASTTSGGVVGNNIRAELRGNTIYLSGAVAGGLNDMTGLALDLTTDVVDPNGDPVVLSEVPVDFNTKTKAANFNEFWDGENGAYTKNGQLILSNGTTYTVNGSGLAVSASDLKLAGANANGYEIKVTVGGRMASWRPEAKDDLIALLNGGTAGFKIEKGGKSNRAMLEAINAAQATITSNTSVESWVNSARSTIWTKGFQSAVAGKNTDNGFYPNMTPHGGSYANAASTDTSKSAITNAFSNAYIVPYLQVNITDYDESGTLTATLTPSYRVDVSGATYDYTNGLVYTVQQGRALSALTGDMSTPVTVEFNLGASFATQKMHQDGKYVYTGDGGAWEINHAGVTGLGTVQINGLAGLIEVKNPDNTGTLGAAMQYDSLQAAVDDTVPEVTKADKSVVNSEVTIKSGFDGACTFTMTGLARTIKVRSLGNKDVTCTSNYVTKSGTNGIDFTFQLGRDTAAVTGNVDIVVNTAANGSVVSSVAKAAAGQVVTLTAMPSQGYKVNTVTAVTNANAAVAVANAGNNKYTFTVPQGATKVTVTPTFVVGDNKASFAVSSNTVRGTATVYTGTSDGKLEQGKTATVTVIPNGGNRTVGLTAYANNGASVSTVRTAVNQYTVTVPSGATLVTVTPTFDVDNGTPFSDVLSSDWASRDVSWIYNKGYTTGYGNAYTFAPAVQCTRWEMVTFLWKAAGYQEVNITNPFTDVSPSYPNAQAYKAIMWAVSKGLVDTSTGRFNPTAKISRADAVDILYKQAGSPPASTSTGFKDVPRNAYYAKAVSWAEQNGITNGKDNRDTFKPNDTITRQEIAKMLHVAFG